MSREKATLPEDLVEQLAQIDVESCLGDPVQLDLAMAERQTILIALQNTDTSNLSEQRRELLNERLVAVLRRNDELLVKAGERLEEVRKAMQHLAPGRAALRGYGDLREQQVSVIRRLG